MELGHSAPQGLGRLIPGKTISYQILKSHLRCYDKVIGPFIRRYCVLIPQTTKEGLETVKQRVESIIKENKLGIASIGCAFYPEDGENADEIINKAMMVL